ncbi:hypothetical protein SteCoe_19364 [Stentor coeruleus]|uniref:Uncharacterized protein n=1 Tax=Stentor coeruleus TaxID=5963 RepID=A0A1R2BU82_9CILI|nr:hypothetical protein SteCoe_19364 [Stentor coeruleus]
MLVYLLILYLNDNDFTTGEGIVMAIALIISSLFSIFLSIHSSVNMYKIYALMRRMLIKIMSEKILRVHSSVLSEGSTKSKFLNSITIDMVILENINPSVLFLSIPPALIFAIILTYFFFGLFGCLGILVSILHIPIAIYIGDSNLSSRSQLKELNDRRIRKTELIIEWIRSIKLYCWEDYFLLDVYKERDQEIQIHKKLSRIYGSFFILSNGGLGLVLFIALGSYIGVKGNLPLSNVLFLISIYIFTQLFAINLSIRGIKTITAIRSALNRFDELMLLQERDNLNYEPILKGKILMENCEVVWKKNQNDEDSEHEPLIKTTRKNFSLKGINFEISEPQLVIVVGPPGSGKTTLLMALLNELYVIEGNMQVKGRCAFVGKDPWIIEDTVRNNILVGSDYNEDKYQKVLERCELVKDIEGFIDKDMSLVSDQKLSGGQQIRIALARALYAETEILLLDNPLSSVDPEVRKILLKTLKDASCKKIVILTSHIIEILHEANNIIMLENGNQLFFGPSHTLKTSEYAQTLLSNLSKKQKLSAKTEKYIELSKTKKDLIINPETKALEGKITFKTYKNYTLYGMKSYWIIGLILFLIISSQILLIATTYWPLIWAESDNETSAYYFYGMAILVVSCYFGQVLRVIPINELLINSNKVLYNKAIRGFCNTNFTNINSFSSGSIIQRFSKDAAVTDEVITNAYFDAVSLNIGVIGFMIVIIIIQPIVAFVIPIWILILYFIFKHLIPVVSDLKSTEVIVKSPLLTTFNSLLKGSYTIRSLNLQFYILQQIESKSINCYKAYIALQEVSSLFQFFFVLTINLLYIANVAVLIGTKGLINANIAGFSLSISSSLQRATYTIYRIMAEFNWQMTSVQRLIDFADLQSEDFNDKNDRIFEVKNGQVVFLSLNMRYRKDLPLALCRINLNVETGSKIAVIGRTGAGKSSFVNVLCRIVNPESGTIFIDGTNYLDIPIKQLRSKISVIPQCPFVFQASLRDNIDPLHTYSDFHIFELLQELSFSIDINSITDLNTSIVDKDFFLSHGQKQLLCLVRAVLKNNKIVVLDEATSSIDQETEIKFQNIIDTKMKDCTIFCITHKLNSMLLCQRVVVFEKGEVVEDGRPEELWQNENSFCRKFVFNSQSNQRII